MPQVCVTAHANDFAACVTGIDLTQPITSVLSDQLRAHWLRYQVLYFPDQPMTHGDLERFTESLGPFGHDPYISPVPGHPNILERCATSPTRPPYRLAAVGTRTGHSRRPHQTLPFSMPRWCRQLAAALNSPMAFELLRPCPGPYIER